LGERGFGRFEPASVRGARGGPEGSLAAACPLVCLFLSYSTSHLPCGAAAMVPNLIAIQFLLFSVINIMKIIQAE
jgi:hypothetical protein